MRFIIIIGLLLVSFYTSAQQWDTLPVSTKLGTNIRDFYCWDSSLYVGGAFVMPYFPYVFNIMKLHNNAWDTINLKPYGPNGHGPDNSLVYNIEFFNDQLYVGGGFSDWGNPDVIEYLAWWDGINWLQVDSVSPNATVRALKVYKNELFIAGNFNQIGDSSYVRIVKWDGANWHNVGSFNNQIFAMEVFQDKLYVGGVFSMVNSTPMNRITVWDGIQWSDVDGGVAASYVACFKADTLNDVLYVGGASMYFAGSGMLPVRNLAKWDGTTWYDVGGGTNYEPADIEIYNDELYVAGYFDTAGTKPIKYIARWDGVGWDSLGLGINWYSYALKEYNGELFVGGNYTMAGGMPAYGLAKWCIPNCTTNIEEVEIIKDHDYLGQCIPNPTNNTAFIPYYLPQGEKGVIHIHNLAGQLISSHPIQPGKNQLEIKLDGWEKGTYVYSIVVGGKTKGSRKMVVN